MNSSTYGQCTRDVRSRTQATEPARGSNLANYIVDVFFVALLAAPFLIFESPATMHDAVVTSHETGAAVVATTSPAAVVAPSTVASAAYGPE